MRLTDVWSLVFERGQEHLDEDFLAWLLRLAYVTGYWDSLSEPERGALCAALGYPVPGRKAATGEDGEPAPEPAPDLPDMPVPQPEPELGDARAQDPRGGVIRASVSTHSFRSV